MLSVRNTHISTAANEPYGHVKLKGIAVAGNVPYMPGAERVPTIHSKAYGRVTDEQEDVDEIYEIPDAIFMKEPNKAYGTNAHIATANEAYGRVKGIPVAENVPHMPVAERIPTIQNKAYGGVSGAAV